MRPTAPAPRPRRKIGGALVAGAAVAATIALFAGVLVVSRLAIGNTAAIDKTTLCPVSGPSAVTIVLVDATDAINPVQRAAIMNRLDQTAVGLSLNEAVEIYQIDPSSDVLTPSFVMCRPVAPGEVNELTGNRRVARERFDAAFKPALANALASAMGHGPAARSPIMEAIQGVSVSGFQALQARAKAGVVLPKRLIVVSDMLQYSDAAQHYRAVPVFEAFKATPGYARTRSNLAGVQVTILYLRRDAGAAVQGLGHIQFWQDWFASQGASVDDVLKVEG